MPKRFYSLILKFAVVAILPEMTYAAGTYYNGVYNSPQRNYSTNGFATRPMTNTSYSSDTTYTRTRTGVVPNNNAYTGNPYQNYTRVVGTETQSKQTKIGTPNAPQERQGLSINAALLHEFASWNFSMNDAGSLLHYDNLRWNVFDVTGKYKFGSGNTKMQIDAGFKYGMQFGDSTMIDDDVTNGGWIVTEWNDWNDANHNGEIDNGELTYMGQQVGHSLSIGTSNSGSLLGFNVGFGLTDAFKVGVARVTPSVGYRYLKYKLETKNDYGLTVDTGYCETIAGTDETQCDPILIFYDTSTNTQQVLWEHDPDWNGYWGIPSGETHVSTGGTYMFKLPSISHSYETTWAGPYVALDLDYDINAYNAVNARVEVGLPMYTSTGDQPYRSDWKHPKSVEDKGDFGKAWHIGLAANYMTALTDSVALSIGMTFDYYTLSGGNASTYLNEGYYQEIYDEMLQYYINENPSMSSSEVEAWMRENDPTIINILETEKECSGWVCKVDNEIESVYKSMGVRVGIQARF